MDILSILSQEFDVSSAITERIVALIAEGNTIPFIARYRKEQTGAMDDQKLRERASGWNTSEVWISAARRSSTRLTNRES